MKYPMTDEESDMTTGINKISILCVADKCYIDLNN
jgi:hypothetical protein